LFWTPGAKPGGTITGFLYWQFGDFCFPDHRWSDFVAVIPAWWIEALRSLDGETKLDFMDGPYFMILTEVGDGYGSIECYEDRKTKILVGCYRIPIAQVKREVVTVASSIVVELQERNFGSDDLRHLIKLLKSPWARAVKVEGGRP
jgi:hypothetical protein